MARLTCVKCKNVWDGRISPFCPSCFEHDWCISNGFIKPKHDPRLIPMVFNTDRSVVTMDFITDPQAFINTLAYGGEFYYDTKHRNFTCFLNQPLGLTSGSAIPANYPWPTHPLDSQKVVSVYNNPHVYAVNIADVKAEISRGRLIAPRYCDMTRCTNLAIPGTSRCSRH